MQRAKLKHGRVTYRVRYVKGRGLAGEGASGPIVVFLLQTIMGRNKDKEKAKRLYESTPNKGVAAKIARTEDEFGNPPDSEMDLGPPLMMDMIDSQEIPTTPSQTERSFGSGMVLDSQLDQPLWDDRSDPVQTSVVGYATSRESGEGVSVPPVQNSDQTPSRGEKPKLTEGLEEEALDWRIPASFRLDWIAARVDQLLIQLKKAWTYLPKILSHVPV